MGSPTSPWMYEALVGLTAAPPIVRLGGHAGCHLRHLRPLKLSLPGTARGKTRAASPPPWLAELKARMAADSRARRLLAAVERRWGEQAQ